MQAAIDDGCNTSKCVGLDRRNVVLATTVETRNAIAPRLFGVVERGVRGIEELVGRGKLVAGQRGITDAHGDAALVAAAGLDAGAQPLGDRRGSVGAGAGQNHAELVAAIT